MNEVKLFLEVLCSRLREEFRAPLSVEISSHVGPYDTLNDELVLMIKYEGNYLFHVDVPDNLSKVWLCHFNFLMRTTNLLGTLELLDERADPVRFILGEVKRLKESKEILKYAVKKSLEL